MNSGTKTAYVIVPDPFQRAFGARQEKGLAGHARLASYLLMVTEERKVSSAMRCSYVWETSPYESTTTTDLNY